MVEEHIGIVAEEVGYLVVMFVVLFDQDHIWVYGFLSIKRRLSLVLLNIRSEFVVQVNLLRVLLSHFLLGQSLY